MFKTAFKRDRAPVIRGRRPRLGRRAAPLGIITAATLSSLAAGPAVASASPERAVLATGTLMLGHGMHSNFTNGTVGPLISNTNCTFAFLQTQGNLFYVAIYNCNNPVKTNNLQGFASFPGGGSQTHVATSRGEFTTNAVTTDQAGYSPGNSQLTLVADIDTGAGFQIQNVSCQQQAGQGHAYHCVTKQGA